MTSIAVLRFDANADGVIDTAARRSRVAVLRPETRRAVVLRAGRHRSAPRACSGKPAARSWMAWVKRGPRPTIARVRIAGTKQDARAFVVIVGGGFSPHSSATGNRILMLDAATGRLLWSAGNQRGCGSSAQPHGSSALPRASPFSTRMVTSLADRMYAADIGGQVWRFDIWNGRDRSQLVTGGVLANLGAAEPRPTPATAADARGFFNAPDVALHPAPRR